MILRKITLFSLLLTTGAVMADDQDVIRINQIGYFSQQEKVLVVDSPVVYDYVWVDGCSAIVNGKWVDSPVIDDFVRQNGIDINLDRRGRISIAEYRSRTMKDTLKRLSFFEIVRRVFNRMRSFF